MVHVRPERLWLRAMTLMRTQTEAKL